MEKERIDRVFNEKVDKLTGLPPEVHWNSKKGWNEYEKRFLKERNTYRRTLLYVGSAAAAILLVVVLAVIFQNNRHKTCYVANNGNEIMEILLPDSNRIWLNRNSSVEYPSIIDENHNELLVDGEIYIEISRLIVPTYIIKAHNALIAAENACAVNIRARSEEENVNISIASGALKISEVSYNEGLALLVTEGNYCSVHKSQKLMYSAAIRNDNYLAWKTGRLLFESIPIATVTDILEEYYQTPIVLEDQAIAYCLFSGTFEDQPIDMVLDQIKNDLDIVIRNTGNTIIISGKGCL